MDLQMMLKKYADLIINKALEVKEGDCLIIRAPLEAKELAHICAETAYLAKAKKVAIDWRDQDLLKLRYEYETEESLKEIPEYFILKEKTQVNEKWKFLSITGNDPNAFKDCDPKKIFAHSVASSKALKEVSEKIMSNYTSWCVVGAAVPSWAKAVFPHLNIEEAMEQLWEKIFYTVRLEGDPIANWDQHVENLKVHSAFLNENKFKYLKYRSEKGTDLMVELPKGYIFSGASEKNQSGEVFIANIPTEEIFSMPHKDGVNGIVYNTKPLNHNGSLIDDFYLKFQNGKVVEYDAKVGKDELRNILESDEGAKRLGEVALVPYDSPISNTNVLFLNTLYDENASCHFALGKAYPTCIQGGTSMTKEELDRAGVNDSIVHVDFMVGDATTSIIGIKENGEEIEIFRNGNFVI